MKLLNFRALVCAMSAALVFAGCGGSSGTPQPPAPPPPPQPPAAITVTGSIFDGPVAGGTLFVFAASDVIAALSAGSDSADRAVTLAAAGPLVTVARDVAGDQSYTLEIPADHADAALFFIFDAAGSEDQVFADQPFNLEAVAIAGAAGSQLTVNLTPHTTLTSMQVRALLDPDGDGTVIDAAAIRPVLATALANALGTFGQSSFDIDLFPAGEDPHTTVDQEILLSASTELGFVVRAAAAVGGVSANEVMFLFAADAADGTLDGIPAMSFELDTDESEDLLAVIAALALGEAGATDVVAVSCTSATNSLRRACEFEALDEFFIGVATCAHNVSEADAATCLESFTDDREELVEECGAVTESRLQLCMATNDMPHNPPFGATYSANFVDPLLIGVSEQANPYFPLTQGAEWIFEGTFEEDGETLTELITITVTDRIKLIDGVRCLVVRDVVEIDGELIEDTDDWFAQDTDGNVWYCGEEVKDYETFSGDIPALPELVAIDGAFKAGRDGDEAGINLPFAPIVGALYRQEVSFGNAEDAIEILAIDASESVPALACAGNCLLTRDFSPLDPGVEENKYYAPGVGKILEIDLETGNRVELISSSLLP